MLSRSWNNPRPYDRPRPPLKEQRGVYQLRRPKSLAEVNHFHQTPYTRRVCARCRKQLFYHWYLPFLDPQKCAKLYCTRDGLGYFTKERYK
jgi:hypothetical protein